MRPINIWITSCWNENQHTFVNTEISYGGKDYTKQNILNFLNLLSRVGKELNVEYTIRKIREQNNNNAVFVTAASSAIPQITRRIYELARLEEIDV